MSEPCASRTGCEEVPAGNYAPYGTYGVDTLRDQTRLPRTGRVQLTERDSFQVFQHPEADSNCS